MTDETVQPIIGDGNAAGSSDNAPPEWVRDPARAYAEIQAARREAAEQRARLREVEKRISADEAAKRADAEKALADQAQWKTLAEQRAAELDALRGEVGNLRRQMLITTIAREMGLPPAIAARLQGGTEEELRADAEALRKELGASLKPGASSNTTAIPGGSSVGMNDEQMRREYFGGGGSGRESRPPGAAGPGEQTSWRFGG